MKKPFGFLVIALLVSCEGVESKIGTTEAEEVDRYFISVSVENVEYISSAKSEKDVEFGGDVFSGEANFEVGNGYLTIYEEFFEIAEMDPGGTVDKVYEAVMDIDGTTTLGKVHIKEVNKGTETEEYTNYDIVGNFKSDQEDKGSFCLSMPVFK